MKYQITAQVLNGATGEIREVIANVPARSESEAVNILFARARKDDYYYRFLGHDSVLEPMAGEKLTYQNQVYWAKA